MERYREVPEINRLIIFPCHLREGLEFAKNQGYYDIVINVGSTTSCKHRLNVSLICEYDFIESLTILGVRLYHRTMQSKSTKCFTSLT